MATKKATGSTKTSRSTSTAKNKTASTKGTKSSTKSTKSTTKSSRTSTNGEWKTINGTHVFIENGKITKGPKNLLGESKVVGERMLNHKKRMAEEEAESAKKLSKYKKGNKITIPLRFGGTATFTKHPHKNTYVELDKNGNVVRENGVVSEHLGSELLKVAEIGERYNNFEKYRYYWRND